jgi:hypothetical protein
LSPADTEDRKVPSERLADERQLEIVPPAVDAAELRGGRAAVERGVHVDACSTERT